MNVLDAERLNELQKVLNYINSMSGMSDSDVLMGRFTIFNSP